MSSKFYYGYRIVAATSVIQMMYLGCVFSFGVLFPEFEAEFGWSRATISGASSSMFLVMGVLGIVMGRVSDVLGPRVLLTVAAAVFATGYLLMYRIATAWPKGKWGPQDGVLREGGVFNSFFDGFACTAGYFGDPSADNFADGTCSGACPRTSFSCTRTGCA